MSQNCMHRKIKNLLILSSESVLFPPPIGNFNINIEETAMLLLDLYECEKRSLTQERTRINRALSGMFRSKKRE
jgi:hypothetical protein